MLLHSDPQLTTLINENVFCVVQAQETECRELMTSLALGWELKSFKKNNNNNLRSGFKTPYKFYSNQEGLFYVSVRKSSETIPALHW